MKLLYTFGLALAVGAAGIPAASAASVSATDSAVAAVSATSNTFSVTKVDGNYKVALNLNDKKFSNKTVTVKITRKVLGYTLTVTSHRVKLGAHAIGSFTTSKRIKVGDTIKVSYGGKTVLKRKITKVRIKDTVHPKVVITDNAPGLATGPVIFKFTFSEKVTGFTAADVVVTGGTKGTLTGSGSIYHMTVTPEVDSTTKITVDVAANSAYDAAGNGNLVAVQAQQLVNTHNPVVTITDDQTATVHSNDQVIFTFTFSQPVTGFSASDIDVVHGTKGAFVAVSQTVYTLVVTAPGDGFSGNMTVDVAAGVATGLVTGAPNLAAEQALQPVNTSQPTVTITDDNAGTVYAGETVTFTFTFSEAVTGFSTGDVVVTGGTKGTFTAVSSTVYALVVTPTDASTTAMTVNVAEGVALSTSTANGNAAATERTQAVDTTHPALTITDDAVDYTNSITDQATAITYTFQFDKDVTGFTVSDIDVTNGTKAVSFEAGATASQYKLKITPTASLAGDLTVAVTSEKARAAITGNFNTAASNVQKVDLVHPLVIVSDDTSGTLALGDSAVFTFSFNMNVTDFVAGDVTATNGIKGALDTVSAKVYTMEITADDNPLAVSVAAGVAKSSADATKTNLASLTDSQTVVGPTLVITSDGGATATGDFTLTFTFSSDVTGFIKDDITIAGLGDGTTGSLSGSGNVYTLLVQPAAASNGTLTANVAAGKATGAGTSLTNSAATQLSQIYDLRIL